jgi:hypothetical protein
MHYMQVRSVMSFLMNFADDKSLDESNVTNQSRTVKNAPVLGVHAGATLFLQDKEERCKL